MLFRLGQVVWVIGALIATLLALGGVGTIFATGNERLEAFGMMAFACVPSTAVCWAAAYVLTGSFWRMPRRNGATDRAASSVDQ